MPVSCFPLGYLGFTSTILRLTLSLCKTRAAPEPLHCAPVTPVTQLGPHGKHSSHAQARAVRCERASFLPCLHTQWRTSPESAPGALWAWDRTTSKPAQLNQSYCGSQFSADPAQYPSFGTSTASQAFQKSLEHRSFYYYFSIFQGNSSKNAR